VQVRPATGAVSRLENGWGERPLGFDSLSFRLRSGVVEWQDARLLIASCRFESCRRTFTAPWSKRTDAGPSSPAGVPDVNSAVDGWPKGVTEQRLTLERCVGRNVGPASLRGEVPPPTHLAVGKRATRRLWAPETAGSNPAGQTCTVEEGAILLSGA
jgi:hypothetical protein